jgi:hypothetical protein
MAKKPAGFSIKGKKFQSDTGGTVKIGKAAKMQSMPKRGSPFKRKGRG